MAGRLDVGIGRPVPAAEEERVRVAPFAGTSCHIVQQGRYHELCDVGILREIVVVVEQRVRIQAAPPARA